MKGRILGGVVAAVLVAAVAGPALPASAATPTPDGNVSSTLAPSWQTNNTVWALAYANGVVYVGGQFTFGAPPGDPSGTGEVARTYLAAFNSTTGALESFDPSITGGSGTEITALAVSPDGGTLYAGGIFTDVNGVYRDNLAAFSTSTGALTSWAPAAFGKVNTIAPSRAGRKYTSAAPLTSWPARRTPMRAPWTLRATRCPGCRI